MEAEGNRVSGGVPWTQEALPRGCGPARQTVLEDGDLVPSPALYTCPTQAVPPWASVASCEMKRSVAGPNGSDDRNSLHAQALRHPICLSPWLYKVSHYPYLTDEETARENQVLRPANRQAETLDIYHHRFQSLTKRLS